MTCQQIQLDLSLYLYGELEFAREEALELHLEQCALCQAALVREKAWHSTLNVEQSHVSLELLSDCRRRLKASLGSARIKPSWTTRLLSWGESLGITPSPWSTRMAVASFLMILGFGAGRYLKVDTSQAVQGMSLFNPATDHVRDIQRAKDDKVRIVIDQIQEHSVSRSIDDAGVRRILLIAAKDPANPAIRIDSVQILKNQRGDDVRDVLLNAVRRDPNAGVRLMALGGLRQFADDPQTREGLMYVLEHDNNPAVRSQAIDLLAPTTNDLEFSPELAGVLQQVMRSDQSDDYVRLRCFELLNEMKSSANVY